jgi:hypothetical protein
MIFQKTIRIIRRKTILVFFPFILLTPLTYCQIDFGAYYTKINVGTEWEAYSRTGEHSDVIVKISIAEGKLVFWRGNSYLPYWETKYGKWDLEEIVPRTGDGVSPMPDRSNVYSHVDIIENSSYQIIIHWRYLSGFSAGNPHGKINRNNFIDEVFLISPDGRVVRTIKKGTDKINDWNDSLNKTTQILQLSSEGFREISKTNPGHSKSSEKHEGNPLKQMINIEPVLQLTFDEGKGDSTKENISGSRFLVEGNKTLWKKGISGTSLEFDGYKSVVSIPADKAPVVSGGSLTIESWFVLGAYPWNWTPILQQGDGEGYFLGVDSHGYPGFKVKVDNIWQQLSIPDKPPYTDSNHFKLKRWYHLAGVYNKNDGMMKLYLNGKEIASKLIGKGGVQTVNTDVRIGKAKRMLEPTEGTNMNLLSDFGFDGLIDELRVYNLPLSLYQIENSFNNYNPGLLVINSPDIQNRRFPDPITTGKFKAIYTYMPYYETWDNMFCFGKYSDIVVGFDRLPLRYIFWHGVSYVPMMVNDSAQWFTNEFCETGFTKDAPGDCEPMSDKGCWDSNVRIIENDGARVVVNWRYRLAEPGHHWANYEEVTGWGDICDWDFYIYPDGVVSKVMRCYSSKPDTWHEWDEQIAVLSEGQHPESVIEKTPIMTLVDSAGNVTNYDWNPDPPNPTYRGAMIQKIYLTGKYDPFTVQKFDSGDVYTGERTWYSVFPVWNHWPTAQVNSSGRNASFPDRASHSSISHLFWSANLKERGKISFDEKILMEGMTDQPATSLTGLARSWLKAPGVNNISGGTSMGYNQSHRAYSFKINSGQIYFEINASDKNPIQNLCFEIRNWKMRLLKAGLKINNVSQVPGPDFRQGVKIDTDGTYTMIIWVALTASKPQRFEINEE